MKETSPNLQIRIHGIDGSTRTFVQNEPDLVSRTLDELLPTRLFTQDRILIADEYSVGTFLPPLLTRIDLITDQFSVWDFPFVIGALIEVTEREFREGLHDSERPEQPGSLGDFPVFLDIEMVTGQHVYLRMEIIAGLPTERLLTMCFLLKERRLIFGLSSGGVGVLNLANMLRFLVHPEPQQAATVNGCVREENGEHRPSLTENGNPHRSVNEKPRHVRSPNNDQVSFECREEERQESKTGA
jgi:hypothetical protein